MAVIEVQHPLVQHKIGLMRAADMSTKKFRELTAELARLLTYETCRDFEVESVTIDGWAGPVEVQRLKGKKVTVVPILRAGLGMLEGMVRLLPTAEVGFLGMVRDEETLQVSAYANRLPKNFENRQVFIIDPMLATGHTLVMAIDFLIALGAKDITCVCLIAAPEGLEYVERHCAGAPADVTVVLGGIDEKLNENGYIVPGLGDAGDRLYGVVPHS